MSKVANGVTHWTIYNRIGSKWRLPPSRAEVVLNAARGIVQSVRRHVDALWQRCQTDFSCAIFGWAGAISKIKMTPDSELLRQFARTNSEDAFAELVRRHVNLVYSAALRKTNGDEHSAKDVVQTVFIDLARKANSLSGRDSLTGWLYTSAHFAAAKIIRGENRRRDREEKFMREPTNESSAGVSPAPSAPDWEKLRPTLDDAMHELKETDREAILLRYFENRQFAEVGAKLGLNENAARMRVERALEKLSNIFTKRGIATVTALASVISANAIQIAPANLAATLAATSIAAAGTGTFTLLKIMIATKLKLGISALVVAGAVATLVIQHQAQDKLRAENKSLQQQIAQLQTDNENFSNRLAEIGDAKKLSDDQFNELLKLRGEVGILRQKTNELEKSLEENQQFQNPLTNTQTAPVIPTVIDMGVVEVAAITTNRFSFDTGDAYGDTVFVEAFVSKDETLTNQMISLSAKMGMKTDITHSFITLNPQNYLPDQTAELGIGEYRIRLTPHIKTQ
jgi:RNA polymerase sigma factor (sigma-70 family)